MKSLSKCVLTAVARTAMLACSAVSASTVYACNGNVCWVVKDRHEYPAESKIIIRTETWKPSPHITIQGPQDVGPEWRTW